MNTPPDTRVLVIEDNDTNRALMTYLLEAFGYRTIEAVDGEIGVEKARTTQPHLIICDVHLPKLDGYGVVDQLKKGDLTKRIPIVAVTALAMVGDRDRILAAGFDGYVSKPISPETFVSEVDRFLPEAQRRKVSPARAESGAEKSVARAISVLARKRILVVDDVPANIEFARSTLEPSGYEVVAAGGVQEALVLAQHKRPDLVLCDLHMRPQSGYDLLRLSKTADELAGIPIAIISSTASGDSDQNDCLRRGAATFIKRPIEPELLIAEVGNILAASPPQDRQ
jgi:two-component system, cell cycle response regulator